MANTTISNALAAYTNAAKALSNGGGADAGDSVAGDTFGDLLKKKI